jgi:hypothetical protein
MDITLYLDDVGAGDHPTVNVDASYGFAGGNGGADIHMVAYVGGADRGVSVNFTIINQYSHQVPDTGAGNIGRGWTIVSVPAQNNGTQNSGQQPHAPAAKPQTHAGLRGRGGLGGPPRRFGDPSSRWCPHDGTAACKRRPPPLLRWTDARAKVYAR